jgi:hypothetical protein
MYNTVHAPDLIVVTEIRLGQKAAFGPIAAGIETKAEELGHLEFHI